MRNDERLRTSVRLKIDKGLVLLRYGGVPSVACTLLDLSEGGCRAVAPLNSLDEQTGEAWKKILWPGRPLNVEISCPPHLTHFPIDVEVRAISAVGGGGVDVGLRFRNVDADQRALLNKAMLGFATDKVRGAFAPNQTGVAGNPASYLVGTGHTQVNAPRTQDGPPASPPPKPEPAGAPPVHTAPAAAAPRSAGPAPIPAPAPAPMAEPAAPVVPAPAELPVEALQNGDDAPLSVPPPPPPLKEGTKFNGFALPTPVPVAAAAPLPPPKSDPFRGKKVGEVLVRMGKLSEEKVLEAVGKARLSHERLGRYLLREGLVTPAELCRALALQSGLPMTDLAGVEISPEMGKLFSHPMMAKHEFVPFDEARKMVCIAAANPLSTVQLKELERASQKRVEVFLAQEDLILTLLDKLKPEEKRMDRRHTRYAIALPTTYQFCNRLGRIVEEITHAGQTVDISEGGFLVEGPEPKLGASDDLLRRGLCLRVKMTMFPHEVSSLCNLRFIKIKEKPEKENFPWIFGLQILELSGEDRRKLKEICIQAGRMVNTDRATRPFV